LRRNRKARKARAMTIRNLFVTKVYEANMSSDISLASLAHSIRTLAQDDHAGRRWSKECGYTGYTSYASLNDLTKRDPAFSDLARLVKPHVAKFAKECAFSLPRPLRLDSVWVNQLPPKGHHRAHIHPHSTISGTLYVEIPKGSGSICFEDPRLASMMAAPSRENGAPEELRTVVSIEPHAGLLLLWESWLRHEVLSGTGRGDRLSVSFNFA